MMNAQQPKLTPKEAIQKLEKFWTDAEVTNGTPFPGMNKLNASDKVLMGHFTRLTGLTRNGVHRHCVGVTDCKTRLHRERTCPVHRTEECSGLWTCQFC